MMNFNKQEALRNFVEKEVFECQSMLVEEAIKREFFSWDDVINFYRRFDGKLLSPNICSSCSQKASCLDSETGECETCFEEKQEPQEIYEWWLVSRWLEFNLKMRGEPILSNEYGTWWGRCCTGQAIYMDGVIEEIYDKLQNY